MDTSHMCVCVSIYSILQNCNTETFSFRLQWTEEMNQIRKELSDLQTEKAVLLSKLDSLQQIADERKGFLDKALEK